MLLFIPLKELEQLENSSTHRQLVKRNRCSMTFITAAALDNLFSFHFYYNVLFIIQFVSTS